MLVNGAVRSAEAAALGITRGQLYGPRYDRLSHGLYLPHAQQRHSLIEQCAALRPVLPRGGAMAHLTAAQLHGLWVPPAPTWLPTLVVLPPGEIRPERAGMYAFRSRAGLPPPLEIAGVPVVPPALVLGQLAEDLGVVDLVVAIDSALHLGLCTVVDILDGIRSRQRGLPVLRIALHLCDGRSESPWETVLRLLLHSAGVPVDPQVVIRDCAGVFLARADLLIRGTRRLMEYDGAVHRERLQHEADLRRDKALMRAGYQRYGYLAAEIRDAPERVLRDAERALGEPAYTRRIGPWLQLAATSTLTREGRVRLARRLHRFGRPLRGRNPPSPPREMRENAGFRAPKT